MNTIVSEKAILVKKPTLLARMQRQLEKEDRRIFKAKAEKRDALGEWFLRDTSRGTVAATHIELEPFARQIGALRDGEVLS